MTHHSEDYTSPIEFEASPAHNGTTDTPTGTEDQRQPGVWNRLRHRVQRAKAAWLETSVPRDEDKPVEPGSLAYTLVGTWPRKTMTLGLALAIGAATAWLVLPSI